jgi:hypothetical protein
MLCDLLTGSLLSWKMLGNSQAACHSGLFSHWNPSPTDPQALTGDIRGSSLTVSGLADSSCCFCTAFSRQLLSQMQPQLSPTSDFLGEHVGIVNSEPLLHSVVLIFFFFSELGLEIRAYTLSHSTSPFFCDEYFRDRVSRAIYPGWLRTMILLISASWVARVTGMNHQPPALFCSLKRDLHNM